MAAPLSAGLKECDEETCGTPKLVSLCFYTSDTPDLTQRGLLSYNALKNRTAAVWNQHDCEGASEQKIAALSMTVVSL